MTPEVVECSWLAERELVGRGRVAIELTDLQGNVEWRLFPTEGTFVLNPRNDFQIFGETFASGITFATTADQPLFTVDLRD